MANDGARLNPADAEQQAPRAGSPFGSLLEGTAIGSEIKPALPVFGPEPPVSPSEVPRGVEGNVIVEITIDEQGNVVHTVLLQGIGYGIDEKVVAVLQNWRFTPATRDGAAIASKQDVHFHFGPNHS